MVCRRNWCRTAAAALLALAVSGCTIQDFLRNTLGGVDSDRATMNKINPANEQSFPNTEF